MQKKEKENKEGCITLTRATAPRALARQWLGLSSGKEGKGGDTDGAKLGLDGDRVTGHEELQARPARLGLGAKYVPHDAQKKQLRKGKGMGSGQGGAGDGKGGSVSGDSRLVSQIKQTYGLGKQRDREKRLLKMEEEEEEKERGEKRAREGNGKGECSSSEEEEESRTKSIRAGSGMKTPGKGTEAKKSKKNKKKKNKNKTQI
eukprot:Nk52_evm1s2650 gene=Nk52_evmTU1s2650